MVENKEKYTLNRLVSLLNQIIENDYGSDSKAVDAIFSMKNDGPSLSAIYRARKGKSRSKYLISCYISDLLSAGTIPMDIPNYLNRECIQITTRTVLKNRQIVDALDANIKKMILSKKVVRPSSENYQDHWFINEIDIYDVDIIRKSVDLYSEYQFSLTIDLKKNDIDCDLSCILSDGNEEERGDKINITATTKLIIPLDFLNKEHEIDDIIFSMEIIYFNVY
ncbi:hypothetical protein [Photobacterium leiognathi]|uniref:hypothetical protein n=1 Tax=Photobacterium leiognathi TaxID=553611 RepID=UPI003AF33BCC